MIIVRASMILILNLYLTQFFGFLKKMIIDWLLGTGLSIFRGASSSAWEHWTCRVTSLLRQTHPFCASLSRTPPYTSPTASATARWTFSETTSASWTSTYWNYHYGCTPAQRKTVTRLVIWNVRNLTCRRRWTSSGWGRALIHAGFSSTCSLTWPTMAISTRRASLCPRTRAKAAALSRMKPKASRLVPCLPLTKKWRLKSTIWWPKPCVKQVHPLLHQNLRPKM